MRPTRRTQPYRKGPRAPSPALTNMQRGKTLHGQNPQDVPRLASKKAAARKRRVRKQI